MAQLVLTPKGRTKLKQALQELHSRDSADWPDELQDLEVLLAIRERNAPNVTITLRTGDNTNDSHGMRPPASLKEAATALGVSYSTIRRWVDQGDIETVLVGKRAHIPWPAIERLQRGEHQ